MDEEPLSRPAPRSGWLVVAVAVLALLVVILGAVAADRWCGSQLCAEVEGR